MTLSEVDRGWLLNGGQDELRILGRMLDTETIFAPAADPVWGDAIMSRLPMSRPRSRAFDSYGAVTGDQALTVQVRFDDHDVAIVSTHLQPASAETNGTVRQSRELNNVMRQAAKSVDAAVLAGDLNTTPRSKAWSVLTSTGFVDALAGARPLLTSPANEPAEEIDHVFSTGALKAADVHTVDTQLSDHLPVFVRLNFGDNH